MKRKSALVVVVLLLLTGCYVRTQLKVQTEKLRSDFSAPLVVVSVQEKVGLEPGQLAELRHEALEALTSYGIKGVTLEEATGGAAPCRALEVLREKKYKALLKIVITFWGSRNVTLLEPASPSVESPEANRESSLFQPGSFERAQRRGPKSTYKEVAMTGSLLDLQNNQLLWSAQLRAGPALVGRSFLYRSFNRGLRHQELARHCFRKLAAGLARIWPRGQAATSKTG